MKHLAYGMVELPSGKIKSREGTKGITADEIIDNVQDLVRKELKKRSKLSKKELENRSRKITLGAIKYFLLKVDTRKNMLFNPKKAISFEGDTGPYIQYSYARASSIIKKEGKEKKKPKFNLGELTHSELELIKKLSQFKEVSDKAYKNLNPSVLANYSYQLSQRFNEFYHSSKVIGSDEQVFRLKLVEAFRQVLKNSLSLIGIDVLEEM
jgi:arginyl-tRNA synthetase